MDANGYTVKNVFAKIFGDAVVPLTVTDIDVFAPAYVFDIRNGTLSVQGGLRPRDTGHDVDEIDPLFKVVFTEMDVSWSAVLMTPVTTYVPVVVKARFDAPANVMTYGNPFDVKFVCKLRGLVRVETFD